MHNMKKIIITILLLLFAEVGFTQWRPANTAYGARPSNTSYDFNTANRFGNWYTTILEDDFTLDITGWTSPFGEALYYTSDYNSVGRTNVYLDSCTTTGGNIYFRYTFGTLELGKTYRLSFRYYVPSSNTTTTGVMARFQPTALNLTPQNIQNTWTYVTEDFVATDNHTQLQFYHWNGTILFATANDKIYLDDVRLTEITPYQNYNAFKNKWDYNPE